MSAFPPIPPLEPLAKFDEERMRWWHGEPASYKVTDAGSLEVTAKPGPAFWRQTLYEPELEQQHGPGLLTRINAEFEFSMTLAVELDGKQDLDSAGCMIFIDDHQWLTAGLEVVNGKTKLSVVATTNASDWSAIDWEGSCARIRIHRVNAKTGSCAVVEAAPHKPGAPLNAAGTWQTLRVCQLKHHLDAFPKTAPHWHVGPYCHSPAGSKESVASAVFPGIRLRPGRDPALPVGPQAAAAVPREIERELPENYKQLELLAHAKRLGLNTPPGVDPLDPEGKYPANWPYHNPPTFSFIRE